MGQALHCLKETPSRTAGSYAHIGLAPRAAGFDTPGEWIRVEGIIYVHAGANDGETVFLDI